MTASGPLQSEASIQKQVYRPPGLRNKETNSTTSVGNAVVTNDARTTRAAPTINTPTTLSKEEKVVKKLKEKVEQIEELKKRMDGGETLELNQIDKVKKEDEVRKELEKALKSLKHH